MMHDAATPGGTMVPSGWRTQMARMFEARKLAAGAALMAAVLMAGSVAPAAAQDGSRMRVLIPAFMTADGKTNRDGERIADQLRKQINEMATHAPVEMKLVDQKLKEFGVKKEDMTCLQWKQLASHVDAALVLCGIMDDAAGTMAATFEPVGGGVDPFKVPAFPKQDPQAAAQHIVQAFGTYTQGLTLIVTCNDFIQNQSWQQALDACNRALEINPESRGAQYAKGTALLNMDRNEEALAAFKDILAADPINQDALQAAGYTASKLGQPDVALGYFRQYLEMNPDADEVRLTIAFRLGSEGDPRAALALIEEAANKPDATRTILMYAGHFALNAGLQASQGGPAGDENLQGRDLFQKAITNYERVLTMGSDSTDGVVLANLMNAYRSVGNIEKALEIGTRATQDAGVTGNTWLVYSDVLREAKRIPESIAALDRAVALNPELANQIAARKAQTQMQAGQMAEAVATVKAGLANGSIPQEFAEQISQQVTVAGWNHAQAQRYQQAISHFNTAREIGKSERSVGMANFFHGFALFTQADALLRTATTAAPARQAKPLLEQSRALMQAAGGFTEQAAKRAEVLQNISTYMEIADALIKAGR